MRKNDIINLKALWADLYTIVEEGEIDEFFEVSLEQVMSLRKAIKHLDIGNGGENSNE